MVLGGFGGVRQFSLMVVDFGHCVGGFGWFWVVLGESGNFPLWGLIRGTV